MSNIKIKADERTHWYTRDGEPMHEVIGKTTGRPRPTTIRDARQLALLPSVTNVLDIIAKPNLVNWLVVEGITAVVTAPDIEGEVLDDKIRRVLDAREHEETKDAAAQLGTDVHAVMAEFAGTGQWKTGPETDQIAGAARDWLEQEQGEVMLVEQVVIGNGYAGTMDLLLDKGDHYLAVDYKTTKSPPKESKKYPSARSGWPEHQAQLSAYVQALPSIYSDKPVLAANVYLSTTEPGKRVVCYWGETHDAFENEFLPALSIWCWRKGYDPRD